MSQHPSTRRDPTDPISGILLGIYDTLGEISLGLVAGPVELGRQATPLLNRYEDSQRANRDGITQPVTAGDMKRAPHAAARVAIESGKGLSRIVTASLKVPVLTLNGVMYRAWCPMLLHRISFIHAYSTLSTSCIFSTTVSFVPFRLDSQVGIL